MIADDAWVDDTAVVIGDVRIGSHSSIWPMSVIRGDVQKIRIGVKSNIQDGCILHVSHDSRFLPDGRPLILGDSVTVGHSAILHGCEIADGCFIGMGCTILDGAVLEPKTLLGAGSLVASGKTLGGGCLWLGRPARCVRPLTDKELAYMDYSADHYQRLAQRHWGSR
ncbi:MAG: gamma carbonic anhydrase family protein [Gammaproteobacteria bacterium]|nr:gamma carbonic anhydrase family protein [Gammaproteobacteria bacterium]